MANDKRERQKALRSAKLEAEKKAAATTKRNRLIMKWGGIVVGILVSAFLYNQIFGEASSISTNAAPESGDPRFESVADLPEGCPAADGTSPRTARFSDVPPTCIDTDEDYVAEISTSAGDFSVLLETSDDVDSVNNFIFLARHQSYNGTAFHLSEELRVVGGDVEGLSGAGSPGYQVRGTVQSDAAFEAGQVFFDNQVRGPVNGSTFFVVTAEPAEGESGLDNVYSPLGRVIAGLDVPATIAARPEGDVSIDSVFIRLATDADADALEAIEG
ncbi:MAG: cyclophilin family peptidyl-prolyl cis-trans isomerase [Candidatus Poriferisodalaceae bacterium]|jgi:cyclophilin family peptidyl-prolyl cis-trans isomerase